jgi:hypothetical protein
MKYINDFVKCDDCGVESSECFKIEFGSMQVKICMDCVEALKDELSWEG